MPTSAAAGCGHANTPFKGLPPKGKPFCTRLDDLSIWSSAGCLPTNMTSPEPRRGAKAEAAAGVPRLALCDTDELPSRFSSLVVVDLLSSLLEYCLLLSFVMLDSTRSSPNLLLLCWAFNSAPASRLESLLGVAMEVERELLPPISAAFVYSWEVEAQIRRFFEFSGTRTRDATTRTLATGALSCGTESLLQE